MAKSALSDYPVAAVTVSFVPPTNIRQMLPLNKGLTVDELTDVVQYAIAIAGREASLIHQPRYDDGDGIMLGQQSGYIERQFIIVPEGDRPFFLDDQTYPSVRVLSHPWGGSAYMNAYDDTDIIEQAKDLAKRIGAALKQQANSEFIRATGIFPWELLSFTRKLDGPFSFNTTLERTPRDWESTINDGVSVYDADGWMGEYPKSFLDDKVTYAEYIWRMNRSTVKRVEPQQTA